MDAERVPPGAYRFDRFTLDLGRRALLGPDGAEVPLRPKSFALLRLLVENPGRVVDRDAIMAAVWPDVVVGDESITQCVRDIRKALGDETQQVLKTVARHGYLLAAEVVQVESAAPAPRAERRLSAILAADIVGYSRLIEQDETGTLAAIKALREGAIDPLLAEHKGRIVKLMGDGAIVEFASVVDAVACAVAIQKVAADRQAKTPPDRRIVFRIGVNLGDVVVDGDDLMGDGVNIAARLEQLCEPGGVLVSGTAYDHLQGRLGMPLEFTGEQQVKNIARPVRAYRVRLDGTAMRDLRGRQVWQLGRRAVTAGFALFLLVAAAAGGWWWRQGDEAAGLPLPDEPSVAVLPFDNPTGDARLGRLADGMVENVIADLPNFGVFVIARGTSFSYRDKPRDPRTVGRELGVHYVVEGSLQGEGERLRATVNLVDAMTGGQVWSERYDRPLEDLFAMQDELAERIANSIGGTLGAADRAILEEARGKPPQSLQVNEWWLLALEAKLTDTKQGNAKALELLQKALKRDPNFGRAYVLLAGVYADQVWNYWAPRDEAAAKWLEAATRAVQLEPRNGFARLRLAQRYALDNNFAGYTSNLKLAADFADGNAALMVDVASELPWAGQTARAVAMLERALRLDPASSETYQWAKRIIYFHARRFEEAASVAEAMAAPVSSAMLYNVMIYAQLGRSADADRWRSRLLEEVPNWSAELHFSNGDYAPAAATERALVLESIAKAGLPMCATPEQLAKKPGMLRMPECEAERAKAAATRS